MTDKHGQTRTLNRLEKPLHSEITGKILQGFFNVYKSLPNGLSVEIYQRALAIEFEQLGLSVTVNKEIKIWYKEREVGILKADVLVNDLVVVKVINSNKIEPEDEQKSKNLLRLSEYEVCLLLNFGGDSEYKRIIFTNDFKKK